MDTDDSVSSPRRICLLADKYPPDPGGLAISTRRLARGLVRHGHTVHVCVPAQTPAPGEVRRTEEEGVIVHRLGAHRRLDDTQASWFDQIVRLQREAGFDLLHGYYLVSAGFVTVYAGRYLGLPTVVSARGNDLDRTVFNPGRAASILWALTHADAVTAVSNDLARRARTLAPAAPVQVIHNGVDATSFIPGPPDPALKTRLRLADQSPLIGFVGEARLKKGLTILLPAFAQIAAAARAAGDPVPSLLLVGDIRPDDADVWRVFKAQHPDLALHQVPQLEQAQLLPLYHLLDVLVLPSLQDGLPNALLEGMACERAVIATTVGGIPDAVQHNHNGLLIPPGEVDALVRAIGELLAAPDRRASLGRAARQTVIEHFTPATELAKNLELYRQLLSP